MSRRRKPKDDTHYVNGIVRFECPDGHPLGRAVERHGHYMLEKGLERVTAEGRTTKVVAHCHRCEEVGRVRDLQASWEKVQRLLDTYGPDPRHAEAPPYVLGG